MNRAAEQEARRKPHHLPCARDHKHLVASGVRQPHTAIRPSMHTIHIAKAIGEGHWAPSSACLHIDDAIDSVCKVDVAARQELRSGNGRGGGDRRAGSCC